MRRIELPDYIEDVLSCLDCSGFEAYVVGGAVRDALLGIDPKDWDIATNAPTDNIKGIFNKYIETGAKYGTITVIVKGFPVEITTYRIDGTYSDSRRPENVSFTQNLHDDLLRRDFTINALAYNNVTGIVDICGGIEDLQCGIIRCIGDAQKRFEEDALRILRALRFSATLNFKIANSTYEAICTNCYRLKNISGERIYSEVTKIIMADRYIERLFDSGVGDVILPEIAKCFSIWQNNSIQIYDVGNHTLEVIYNVPKKPILRYAALLHDIGKAKTRVTDNWGLDYFPGHAAKSAAMAREILTRFKMSNKSKLAIVNLVRNHSIKVKPTELSVRRVVSKLGKAEFIDFLSLKRANILGQNPKYINEKLKEIDKIEEIYHNVLEKNLPMFLKDLAVNGNDMKSLGFKSSEIGRMLHLLLALVIKKPELNNKELLIELARKGEKGEK